jgi:NAD(P)-dependent dehydrogenase (short-subunit alcohol dehydrogenase family)
MKKSLSLPAHHRELAATARLFAKNGFNVVINYSRDPKPAEAVADGLACKPGGPARFLGRSSVGAQRLRRQILRTAPYPFIFGDHLPAEQ